MLPCRRLCLPCSSLSHCSQITLLHSTVSLYNKVIPFCLHIEKVSHHMQKRNFLTSLEVENSKENCSEICLIIITIGGNRVNQFTLLHEITKKKLSNERQPVGCWKHTARNEGKFLYHFSHFSLNIYPKCNVLHHDRLKLSVD